MAQYVFTILGCSASGGVPRIGNDWGACDPDEPKNRRRRSSMLVRRREGVKETRVLIDTSPDLREQLLDADVATVDAALITHDHADHIHGIDDLRHVYFNRGAKRVPVHADPRTANVLRTRFGYCFETPPGSDYPAILDLFVYEPYTAIDIEGEGGVIRALPVTLHHGKFPSHGFVINGLGYLPDLNGIPEESLPYLEGLKVLITDALRPGPKPHPTHLTLEESLEWIERLKPERAILTDLHTPMDYATLKATLPADVEPAYDGLTLSLPG